MYTLPYYWMHTIQMYRFFANNLSHFSFAASIHLKHKVIGLRNVSGQIIQTFHSFSTILTSSRSTHLLENPTTILKKPRREKLFEISKEKAILLATCSDSL